MMGRSWLLCTFMFFLAFASMFEVSQAKECEVCEKVVEDIRKSVFKKLPKGKKPPVEFVEKKLHSYCKFQAEEANNKKGDVTKPNTMCYYLEPVKRDLSTPLAGGLPASAICQKLKKHDDAICSLEWGEQLKTGKTKKEL